MSHNESMQVCRILYYWVRLNDIIAIEMKKKKINMFTLKSVKEYIHFTFKFGTLFENTTSLKFFHINFIIYNNFY